MDKPKPIEKFNEEMKDLDVYGVDFIQWLRNNDELKKIFTNKQQLAAIILIVERVQGDIDDHTYEDDSPHDSTIAKEVAKLEEKFKVHRHNLDKKFSAQPEF